MVGGDVWAHHALCVRFWARVRDVCGVSGSGGSSGDDFMALTSNIEGLHAIAVALSVSKPEFLRRRVSMLDSARATAMDAFALYFSFG